MNKNVTLDSEQIDKFEKLINKLFKQNKRIDKNIKKLMEESEERWVTTRTLFACIGV